jgi:hypothetical protein
MLRLQVPPRVRVLPATRFPDTLAAGIVRYRRTRRKMDGLSITATRAAFGQGVTERIVIGQFALRRDLSARG